MSESLRPWLRESLIKAAETYGANLSAVPLEEKGKKVQISEFLTTGAENEDSAVWANVHDKALVVPVKFSKEAVVECNNGRRMTELKTALVTIKKFKPISTRIPNRNGGMSIDPRLALHCELVTMIGSFDEGKWGNPRDVESDAELKEWGDALTKDGGAGNVLKERKKAREGESKKDTPRRAKPSISPRKPPPDSVQNTLDFVRPSPPPRPATPERGRLTKASSYLTAPTPAQRRRSQILSPNVRKVARPPPPPPPPSGPPRVLVPNSDTSQSSQPIATNKLSQPQSQSIVVPDLVSSEPQAVASRPEMSPRAAEDVDAEMLSEDDAQTDRRLRRGRPMERPGPAKKRRIGGEKLSGFRVNMDMVELKGAKVGWERICRVLR
ncbi:hypothetical protein B0H16DRAFT_1495201 [Mycena metata]|uniref:Telomere replication protein EST3 n=1 Tax=Mycena metata TaxID=1033252 RepID=A0AAD7KCX6_9AGAR|nr:hypothetical protein B0H16DRAFT_1495201 [Mycena metata]